METIFLLSGYVVSNFGGFLSILFFGILPIHVFLFFCYKKKIKIKSALSIIYLSLASILSLFLIAVIFMTIMALGAWGR